MSLEKKKIQLNIAKAETGVLELEFKIEERKQDIKRMEEHIQLQLKRIEELKEEQKQLKE